nr:hypothetical protein [Leptospira sanjuanensis]
MLKLKTAFFKLPGRFLKFVSTKIGKYSAITLSLLILFIVVTAILNYTKYKCLAGDCENGFAKMQYRNGAYYEGYVKNSHPDGYGLFKNDDGHFYKGEWRHGVKHGRGQYRYPDGSAYSGSFVNNKKHGLGMFVWQDGTILSAQWNDDEPDGAGTLILADGTKLNGVYKEGRIYDGSGAFIYPDGNIYIGSWRAGKRNGFGIFKDSLGKIIFKGNWKNDRESQEGK